MREDERTVGTDVLLGVEKSRILPDVIEWGQADFDSPWNRLTADERVLLYAYLNQKGHLEELIAAFIMLFSESAIKNPLVIDLGCGPFTGGLALAAALPAGSSFTYIGMDRSATMRRLGEKLAAAARPVCGMASVDLHWVDDLVGVKEQLPDLGGLFRVRVARR